MKNQEDVGLFHDRSPPKFGLPKHISPGLVTWASHATKRAKAVCVKLQENKAAEPTHLLHWKAEIPALTKSTRRRSEALLAGFWRTHELCTVSHSNCAALRWSCLAGLAASKQAEGPLCWAARQIRRGEKGTYSILFLPLPRAIMCTDGL